MKRSISTPSLPNLGKSLGTEWVWLGILLLIVGLLWCAAYNRWTLEAWRTPVSYTGDAWAEMATAKAFASGDVRPILPKNPASLGAPFAANWNDYPLVEEGIFYGWGILVRIFGIFTGSNLAVLSAQLLAATSFYFVSRALHYHRIWSLAGAVLFSMSHFAFARSLWHLILTFYWHVPLGLLVVWWCLSTEAYANKRKVVICILIAVLHGVQNVYFTGIFLQFLSIAAVICLVRRDRWRQVLFPLSLACVALATFALMNADTLYYQLVNGPNPAALVRIYSGLEIYALRPVELLLPALHRWDALQAWTNRTYYSQTMFRGGENDSLYLGLIAIAALAWLVWISIRAVVRRNPAGVPGHAWAIGWVLVYSVTGGLNGLLGTFGLVVFRGTNRYSIVIQALALLFLVRQLSRLARNWKPLTIWATASLILLVGLWDQMPRSPGRGDIHQVHEQIVSDGAIVASLEAKLPRRAMIFQLPVADFPEVPQIVDMLNYEHFRPYLHSRSLRFSYGSQKGRTRERWQTEVMQFGVARAVTELEKYGFAAVLINKRGYADRAASLLTDLRSADRKDVLGESDDLIAVALKPLDIPFLPPEFDQNWYGLESNETDYWRWSAGNASLIFYNGESRSKQVRLAFSVGSIQIRHLDIYSRNEKVYEAPLGETGQPTPVDITVSLHPGKNELRFQTDLAGAPPGNGDPRKLAFCINNFKILE